jgi:site-specific recombinase XerD
MGQLVQKVLERPERFLRKKHQYSKKSQKERLQKLLKFIRFCEQKGVKELREIKPEHYSAFVKEFLSQKSTETRRKYLLVLREFFRRAQLPIRVNVSRNIRETKEKKMRKLLEILKDCKLTEKQMREIMKLL